MFQTPQLSYTTYLCAVLFSEINAIALQILCRAEY